MRPRTINGTKSIRFRVSKKMYDIIKEASDETGITVSELCRNAIHTYFMSIIVGKRDEIEKEFRDYAKRKLS